MYLAIETANVPLRTMLSALVAPLGHRVVLRERPATQWALTYRASLPLAEVSALLKALAPLEPVLQPRGEVGSDDAGVALDAVLSVGDHQPLSTWSVSVHTDDDPYSAEVAGRLRELGCSVAEVAVASEIEREELHYGGASRLARQLVRWALGGPLPAPVVDRQMWSESDHDIWLYARNHALIGVPVRERLVVEVVSDDPLAGDALVSRLLAAGFARATLLAAPIAERPAFSLELGGFARRPEETELRRLLGLFLTQQHVHHATHPLQVHSEGGALNPARVTLPLGRLRAGALRPWAGSSLARWDVALRTDQPTHAAPLVARLAQLGLEHVQIVTERPGPIDTAIRSPPEAAGVARAIAEVLRETLPSFGAPTLEAVVGDTGPGAEHLIAVELPDPAGPPRHERVRALARNWKAALKCPHPDQLESLQGALRELPWESFRTDVEEVSSARIDFGGAPRTLMAEVAAIVERLTGHRPELRKQWTDTDHDVWIYLPGPASAAALQQDAAAAEVHWDGWLGPEVAAEPATTFVRVAGDRMEIASLSLARRAGLAADEQALVPAEPPFGAWCLDQRTAETLAHVAECVSLGEPCLLEGETSVSKTSVILYLAALLRQPVVRLNLNGQTDTGELIGRYVPSDEPVAPGAAARPWRWQDGLVVQAMRRGWWVVLDELNLAEPQILERLNPLLERTPTLVLTEHHGETFGGQGEAIAAHFRMFATMNPAEYAGRSPLSPAWRDRWRGYRYVRAPDEDSYLAMLRLLVYGEQPAVVVQRRRYAGSVGPAPMAALAEIPEIDGLLRALARFQTAVERAAAGREGGLGARRKERYVFTRRGLLALMEFLALATAAGGEPLRELRRGLLRYYVGRVHPGDDQTLVGRLLDAAGIGPGCWDLGGGGGSSASDDGEAA